jgi:hypothetical protein
MKLIGPERFDLTFDAKKCSAKFSQLANSSIPKLYVVVADSQVIYVGIAKRAMRDRLYGGWNATGKNGYHGYAWRHTHTQAQIFVWYHEDASDDPLLDLETVEAEVVFLVRNAGQWPCGQTEIHFHPSGKEHRELASNILSSLAKPELADSI